jgi:hypothetical protein
MAERTLTYTEELVVHTCWCGMAHAIPRVLSNTASREGTAVYCPAGHTWVVKNSEMSLLKQQVATRTAELDQERARANAAEAKAKKLVAEAKRLQKRASAGVCPCCNRTFQNVGRHMKTQHPDHGA